MDYFCRRVRDEFQSLTRTRFFFFSFRDRRAQLFFSLVDFPSTAEVEARDRYKFCGHNKLGPTFSSCVVH